jgi:hypothetical protein
MVNKIKFLSTGLYIRRKTTPYIVISKGTLKGENIYRTKLGRKYVGVDRATIKAILVLMIRPKFSLKQGFSL